MSPRDSILSAIVATGVVQTGDILVGGERLQFSKYVSLVFIAIMLVLLASFVPDVAAAFAWLVFVAVLLTKGPRVLKAIKF